MERRRVDSEPNPRPEILSEMLSYHFRSTREGQIARGRAMGAQLIGISAAGLPVTAETLRPINSESDPKIVRPFKKWLRKNGHKDFAKTLE